MKNSVPHIRKQKILKNFALKKQRHQSIDKI